MRKATESYRTLYIPSKTATLIPEFAMDDLPLGTTAALVPEFVVTALRQNMMMIEVYCNKFLVCDSWRIQE